MRTRHRLVAFAVGTVILTIASLIAGTGQAAAAPFWPPAAHEDQSCIFNWDGRQECFWVGTSTSMRVPGGVWHRYQNADRSWSGPASLGGWFTSGLNVAMNLDGRLEVFGRAAGGDLAHRWQVTRGGAWGNAWSSLGGALSSGPWLGFTDEGGIMVDVFGPDGIWHRRYQADPGCCWTDWVNGVRH